ncbi:MAG: hypothetical protein NTZ05_17475, partial [Chloroflexi bacterium]|nr:hypothetical protein [Chloroflexota bacterium]
MTKDAYFGKFSRVALGAWAVVGAVALSACAGGTQLTPLTPANLPPQPSSATQPPAAAPITAASAAIPPGPVQVVKATKTLTADLTAAPAVPAAITRKEPAVVKINLDVVEREGELAE